MWRFRLLNEKQLTSEFFKIPPYNVSPRPAISEIIGVKNVRTFVVSEFKWFEKKILKIWKKNRESHLADLTGNCYIFSIFFFNYLIKNPKPTNALTFWHIISYISGVLQYELNYWTSWLYMLFFRTNLVSILGKNGQMAIVAMSTLKVVMRPKNIVLDGLWEIPTTIMSIYWKNHAWASSYAAKGPHRRYNRDLLSQISMMDLKLKKTFCYQKLFWPFHCLNKLF